jgi:protoporphyrinogen oxidase
MMVNRDLRELLIGLKTTFKIKEMSEEIKGTEVPKKEKTTATAIKLPHELLLYLKKNPKFTEAFSKKLVSLIEFNNLVNKLAKSVLNPDQYEDVIESGTKEDLTEFIKGVIKSLNEDKIGMMTGSSEDFHKAVKEIDPKGENSIHVHFDDGKEEEGNQA